MEFEPVIGLEVHAQLNTTTKIFCSCSTAFGAAPNTHTCPVCLGMPGVLPVLNKRAVDFTLRMALATHCRIARESRFARKNYFYPDLPKGYQISQYDAPIAQAGFVDIELADGPKRIGIHRIHMEEDAGKLGHDPDRPVSLVDFNRTGVPLMEIVSEPDIGSPEEAGEYLRKLRSIVRYLKISDGNLEEGSFRCDANISIRPKGGTTLGTRTEVKNLNSFKHVEKALRYEIHRQRDMLRHGESVLQETLLWDPDQARTIPMRGKEEAHDYRYFPDPDLLPLIIDDAWIDAVRQSLPELPDEKKTRFMGEYGLLEYDALHLTASREIADYFEAGVAAGADPKTLSHWIMGPLTGLLHAEGKHIDASPISPADLARLIRLMADGVISGKIAKTVFDDMARDGKSPELIVKQKNLVQVSDSDALEAMIVDVLSRCSDEVAAYRNGKKKLFGFFVGQVMKESQGKANPTIVNTILKAKLEN